MAEKDVIISIRLTEAEKKAAKARAESEGRKLAGWIKFLVRGAIARKAKSK